MKDATGCAIVQSAIYLTTSIGHEDEARANALSVIYHRLQRGSYEQGSILHTSYLGPDLDKLSMFDNKSNAGDISETSSSTSVPPPVSFYIAIGVVSLALCALLVLFLIAIRVRKERQNRNQGSNLGTNKSSEMTVDDMYTSYASRPPRHYDRTHLLENSTPKA